MTTVPEIPSFNETSKELRKFDLKEFLTEKELEKLEELEKNYEELFQNWDENSKKIGEGTHSEVFSFKKQGEEYAVKKNTSSAEQSVDEDVAALLRTQKIDETPDIHGYSKEDQLIIMEKISGKNIEELKKNNQTIEPKESHIIDLIDAYIEMNERGVVADPHFSNFFYDEDQGFKIVDLELEQQETDYDEQIKGLLNQIKYFKEVLVEMSAPRLEAENEVLDFQKISNFYKEEKREHDLKVILEFLRILKDEFPTLFKELKKEQQEASDKIYVEAEDMNDKEEKYVEEIKQILDFDTKK